MATQNSETTDIPLPDQLDFQELHNAAQTPTVRDRDIDVSFFSHKSRKSTQLIGNKSDENSIIARRDWLSFDFNQPIYVTSIVVYAVGYEDYHEIEISMMDALTGQIYEDKRTFGGESFLFEPKRFIRGFGLNPDRPFFKSARVNRIEVRGIEQRDFSDLVSILNDINQVRDKIETSLNLHFERAKAAKLEMESNRTKIAEQDVEIEDKNSQIEQIEDYLTKNTIQLDDLNKKIAIAESVEKESNERIQLISNNINSLNERRKEISLSISKNESLLRDLKNNINLFPTEIAGYVKQGTNNIRIYFWLSFLPLLLIGFVTVRLFYNSEKLLDFYSSGNSGNIFEFLVSRSPYVVVSATIIGACATLCRGLIAEIININRRRQELFKISIIASDISYASQDNLDLDDSQRYEFRTQTKMEMLKEHLRMNIGRDFSYSPGREYIRKIGAIDRQPKLAAPEDSDSKKDAAQ